jgi:ABC-2 type transport system permease protein
MTISRPLSTERTIWLIARLSLRRQLNRWQSARFRRQKNDALAPTAEPRRSGSPTKSRRRSLFSGFILLAIAFNGFIIGSSGLVRLSRMSRNLTPSSDRILVSSYTQAALVEADNALHRIRDLPDPGQREQNIVIWNRHLDDLFLAEVRREGLSEDDESNRLQQMHSVFNQEGAAGFADQSRDQLWISSETWPRGGQPSFVFLRSLSLIVLLWISFIVFGSLGLNNKNLGDVESNFEWLYTFPASTRALFASKLFVYSFLNPAVWLFFFPLLVLVYFAAGYGLGAIFAGMAVLIYLSVLAGALCTFLEVALRKLLSLSQLKNIQALFTVLGTTSFMLVFAACLSQSFDNFLIARAANMPRGLAWNPFTLPLILGLPSAPSSQTRIVVILMIFVAFAFCYMGLLGSEWLTREGLVKAGGPYQGTRRIPEGHSRHVWLRGIAAQEMLLLARDRNLLVQVLVVPLLVPVFYLLVYSGKVSVVSGDFRHAAVMAFGIGAYSFLSSAMPLLNRENKTLWQFLTFPQALATILAKKTVVWAVLGLLYGGATLLLISRFSRHLHAGTLGDVFLALYGIALYAFIAAGIGVLATNVLETEPRGRFRRDMVYLYLILAAMYANAIYSASLWAKLIQLVLSTLLAFALWQKVNDITPFLLDPVARLPRSLSLADGMIAALAFFVVQGLLSSLIHAFSDASVAAQITFAYLLAGLIVAGFALLIFWRRGVPDLWKKIGVSGAISPQPQPFTTGVLRAVALGSLAALGAMVYVRVLNFLPQGQIWKQDAQLNSFLSRADRPIWVCILAIVAAPVFEELLFRGLIFQSLWRTTGPTLAILGSAAVFALVHPPVSVIPVFVLGIAAAISFRKSGFLLAPVLTHATYNTIVIFLHKP